MIHGLAPFCGGLAFFPRFFLNSHRGRRSVSRRDYSFFRQPLSFESHRRQGMGRCDADRRARLFSSDGVVWLSAGFNSSGFAEEFFFADGRDGVFLFLSFVVVILAMEKHLQKR